MGKNPSLFDTFRYAMNTLYRLEIQVFLVPLSQVYNTKHLSMQSTFKNIFFKKKLIVKSSLNLSMVA